MMIMKQLLISGMLILTAAGFSQSNPKLEASGAVVKATYYHDNGQIAQEGVFKNGKLDGKWVSFNEDGSKKSIGEYTEGNKTGKWFFWNGAKLSEVDYQNSRVAYVKTWQQQAPLVQNN
jgi:antitoxin component YwqK of YwqJK toxin-antitoxin module